MCSAMGECCNSDGEGCGIPAVYTEVEDVTAALDGWTEFLQARAPRRPDLLTNDQSKRLKLWDFFLQRLDPVANRPAAPSPY